MVNSVKRQPVKNAPASAENAVDITGDWQAPQRAIDGLVSQLASNTRRRLLVGYSGGLDSHVLLHCLSQTVRQALTNRDTKTNPAANPVVKSAAGEFQLLAVHVNHNLQPESHAWAQHCRQTATLLGIECVVHDVQHNDEFTQELQSSGVEAAARRARFAAFAEQMAIDDCLLLAQHADDQAETFLLQALRGSGPDGLAAMSAQRDFAPGLLIRPFLECRRIDLEAYARHFALHSIEDPSNTDERFDRNFIRRQIMPRLAQRWPAANRTLSRTTANCAAASSVINDLAADDLARIAGSEQVTEYLGVDALLSLSTERRFNVLRCWIRSKQLSMPPLSLLQQLEQELLQNPASSGKAGTRGYEFRRYRDRLYLLHPSLQPCEAFAYRWPQGLHELDIPELGLSLSRDDFAAQGLVLPKDARIDIRSRRGGEQLAVGQPVIHKSVKKLMQEAALPPWQRARVPLIFVNDELAAVWKIAVASGYRQG